MATRIHGDEGGYIYIARYIDTWKIGCTRETASYVSSRNTHGDLGGVRSRLTDLRRKTGADWNLVHVMYAPKNMMQVEHELHVMCDNFRCSRLELYALPGEMFAFIKTLKTCGGNAVSRLEVA